MPGLLRKIASVGRPKPLIPLPKDRRKLRMGSGVVTGRKTIARAGLSPSRFKALKKRRASIGLKTN